MLLGLGTQPLALAARLSGWTGASRGTRTSRCRKTPSGAPNQLPARTSRSWEVRLHQRQDETPDGYHVTLRTAASMRVRREQDDLRDLFDIEARSNRKKGGDALETHARLDLALHRRRQARNVRGRDFRGLRLECEQDLLLPLRAPEVTLQVVVAGANVLEGMGAVQVLRSGEHGHPQVPVRIAFADVMGIEVVQHGRARDDVDASDGVDHMDQTGQSDPDVVIDVNAEVVLDCGDGGARSAIRVGAVDLCGAAGRERDPEIAGDR